MLQQDDDRLLSVKEVAEIIGIHQQTVRELIKSGEIAIVRIGKREYKVRLGELRRFIREREGKWQKSDDSK